MIFSILAYKHIVNYIKDKYSPNEEMLTFFSDDQTDMIFDFAKVEYDQPVKIVNGHILMRYEVIKEFIDPHIYYDKYRNKVIITTQDKVFKLTNESLEARLNKKDIHLDASSREIDGYLYVPIKTFLNIWQIHVQYLEENDVLIVEKYRSYQHTAQVNNPDSVIRKGPSIKEGIYLKNVPQDQLLYVSKTEGDWLVVMTKEGLIGYIEASNVNTRFEEKEVVIKTEDKKLFLPESVVLAWDYVHTSLVTRVPYYKDINVVSPTFFTVVDAEGSLASSASIQYVENAHKRGYKVWPLINNNFANKDIISAVLADSKAREKVIDQLLAYAYICGFDGINVDFENLYLSDKDNLTQFIRELVPLAHEMNLAVSIDVGIPGGSEAYSLCYDHEELGKAADYVMVMTYDQYWAGHTSGGSQAQLSWVEINLKKTLELIKPEKLVLGIPAYTRLWRTDTSGKVSLHATLTANGVLNLLEEKQLTPSWEEYRDGYISGQNYIEYNEKGEIFRAWIEDEMSAELKAQLGAKYKLAGVCVWMMEQTNRAVWEAIADGFYSYQD